jgi:hypothetical protein
MRSSSIAHWEVKIKGVKSEVNVVVLFEAGLEDSLLSLRVWCSCPLVQGASAKHLGMFRLVTYWKAQMQ